ncbi:hypothetical protein [Lamprobacter modestohalophilus]|uniref:hypothetical protein n=1 Tax=Lamprobacter modestohalophilus TaxID=1064514 RepID=UPI001908B0A6|nr:hypothetical protein [Lamprobacter modestohalophilus]
MLSKTLLTSVVLAGGLIYSVGSIGGTVTLDVSDPGASTVPDSFGDTTDVNFTWGVNGDMKYWSRDSYSGKDAFFCGTSR